MFDGPSTVPLRWDGPGLVLDLSAVPLDSDALPLVMVAAAGWLQQLMACPGPQRVQVLDEAWALLGNRHTAGYLQTCFKLGRTYGTANLCITHRASDLVAQADDGSSTAKIAAGLLADSATKIILRQAPDQLDAAARHFGLTEPESPHRRPAHSRPSAVEGRRPNRRGPPPHRTERGGASATPTHA